MITTRTLGNGVRVVMERMPQVQSIAIGFYVRTGAVDEEEKYSGISHFVEHMMFKGTENRTAREIAGDIDRIGGQMNAFTGKEATCYYVKSVAGNYKRAAEVLIDMLENSLFDREELNRERKVVTEELKMGKDSPEELAHDTLVSGIFKDCTIGKSIIGTRSSLKRITHNVMKEYVEKQYTRDSIVISIAGNFDEDEICGWFEHRLDSLPAKKPERIYKNAEYHPFRKSIRKDIEQVHLCMGVRGISITDPRFYAYQIMNNILGGSMSSRLFQNIREQKGLAYSVYSAAGTFSRDGYFEIYAGVGKDRVRPAMEGICEELEKLKEAPVTQEELDSSREQLKSSYVFSQESSSARMVVNGKNYLLTGKIFSPEEVLEGYDKVTAEDIEDVKKLICDFEQYSASAVGGSRVNFKGIMGERK